MIGAGEKLLNRGKKTQGLLMREMTKTQIEGWQSEPGAFTHWDGGLPGFGVRRQTANGSTSFILKLRIDGKQKTITLGRVGILTVSEARAQAKEFLKVACLEKNRGKATDILDRYLSR